MIEFVKQRSVVFDYKNYKGVVSERLVRPIELFYGYTSYYPNKQWLLKAWDLNKDAERTFAMADISDWKVL